MKNTEAYNIVSNKGLSVKMNGGYYIYKGLVFYKDKVLCTDKEFYQDISDLFYEFSNFDQAVNTYLKNKYKRKLNVIEDSIRNEVNGNNNHNKYKWLKFEREHYLNKYNEISIKETTRG